MAPRVFRQGMLRYGRRMTAAARCSGQRRRGGEDRAKHVVDEHEAGLADCQIRDAPVLVAPFLLAHHVRAAGRVGAGSAPHPGLLGRRRRTDRAARHWRATPRRSATSTRRESCAPRRPSLPAGLVLHYPSEAEATVALQQGDIDRYYVVPADYVASGRLTVVQARYQPLRAVSSGELMTYVLNTGIGGDERLARLLLDPTPVVQSTRPGPGRHRRARQRGGQLPAALPADVHPLPGPRHDQRLHAAERLGEKENRTAEMLLVSLRPRDLMLGKIAGLSVVGLLQVAIWMAFFFGIGGGSAASSASTCTSPRRGGAG